MELLQKQQITESVNRWLNPENPERSAAKLAIKSGVNAAYISNIKQGKYIVGNTNIPNSTFEKLAEAIGHIIKQEDGELHWETYNFKFINKVCKSAQSKKKIVILDSEDSGVGKTYALEHYKTYHDKVLYIKCTSSMGGKDLLNEILYKLQIKDKLVGNNAKINAIKTKVVHSPGYLIIIDEAEDVKIGIYKLIKEIIDFTYTKVGVVVSGMRLIDKIELLAYKGRQGFPQLKRRLFTNKARVQQIARTEIVDICAKHGIVNVSAHKWFENNVKDFQMLSEYIKDSLSIAKKDGLQVRSINGDFMNENFNLF